MTSVVPHDQHHHRDTQGSRVITSVSSSSCIGEYVRSPLLCQVYMRDCLVTSPDTHSYKVVSLSFSEDHPPPYKQPRTVDFERMSILSRRSLPRHHRRRSFVRTTHKFRCYDHPYRSVLGTLSDRLSLQESSMTGVEYPF